MILQASEPLTEAAKQTGHAVTTTLQANYAIGALIVVLIIFAFLFFMFFKYMSKQQKLTHELHAAKETRDDQRTDRVVEKLGDINQNLTKVDADLRVQTGRIDNNVEDINDITKALTEIKETNISITQNQQAHEHRIVKLEEDVKNGEQ